MNALPPPACLRRLCYNAPVYLFSLLVHAVDWTTRDIADMCADYLTAASNGTAQAWLADGDNATLPCNVRPCKKGANPQTYAGKPLPQWVSTMVTESTTLCATAYRGRFPTKEPTVAEVCDHLLGAALGLPCT